MSAVFADTWFFIAHLHRFDPGHAAALRLARMYRTVPLVTHDGVLTEVLSFFSGHGEYWRKTAASIARGAISDPRYRVTPLSRELFVSALALYEDRGDKEYSLVDCASMHLMHKNGITHVLTNDHHFTQAGFTIVNG